MVVGASQVDEDGFTVRNFEVLVKPLMSVWQNELKENFTQEVKHAWQTLFRYITEKSKEGYENAVKRNDAENREWPESKKLIGSVLLVLQRHNTYASILPLYIN